MPFNRFRKLRRLIHFTSEEDASDRYAKLRPVLEKVRQNCCSIQQEHQQSVDEMMVPYKGTRAGKLRQYLRNKPNKWGFELFVHACVSGMVYDILPYAGSDTCYSTTFTEEEESLGLGAKVVIALCKTLQQPQQSVVYFDDFFCSLELLKYLNKVKGVRALATIRPQRLRNCALKEDKKLKDEGCGSYDFRSDKDSEVTVVKWLYTKAVYVASTSRGVEPLGTVKRYVKEQKKKVLVPAPRIILEYNTQMGGVDLAGMFVELYRTPLKSRRYYLKLFAQLIDICVNNAWHLYRRAPRRITATEGLQGNRATVTKALLAANKKKSGRLSPSCQPQQKIKRPKIPMPQDDIRYDGVGHWQGFAAKGRCRYCPWGQTRIICTKCGVLLCFMADRNCFRPFHSK
ncbi:piggyBac transposable element-derived protein 2-like [Ornithodoros turicata]|uniref:piggyBac transposable element-derived protein 2-like n=1 Tax=Ornithodoros turicata TaxID=34597 RepID=UPI00313A15BB